MIEKLKNYGRAFAIASTIFVVVLVTVAS